jgi:hypothetical protein
MKRFDCLLFLLLPALAFGQGVSTKSGASSDLLTVDPTSKAARQTEYDTAGNALAVPNRGAVAETAGGVMQGGKDYKLGRTLRVSSTGTLQVAGDGSFLLIDTFEGTTRNSTQWVETATTQTSAQTLATGLRLNTASTLTTTTGILESSHRQMPIIERAGLVFKARLRYQGATNCLEEWGFSDQASATTALHNNGAFFRRDSAGSLQPVLAFNGTETQGTVFASPPATTEYATYEIFLEDDRATFQIVTVAGVVSAQVMERGSSAGGAGVATQARLFAVTHLPVMFRTVNTGAAGTAPQIDITQVSVTIADGWSQRDHRVAMSGIGLNSFVSPTAFTQLANWGNSAAPTTRTLSNTAAAETTLGGLLRVNSIAGGNTDYIMFGFQNPSPYTFYLTGISIPPPLNEVVAVATTATTFAYFVAVNSSAVSLATGAPYTPMRQALPGIHTAAVGLAAGSLFSGNNVTYTFATPIAVQPGRFLHVGTRELVGTATATETYLWAGVTVDGFFE